MRGLWWLLLLAAAACGKGRSVAVPASAQAGKRLVSSTPAPAPGALSAQERAGLRDRLSFISERDHDREVYLIQASGTGERRLTQRPGGDYNGPASPDGRELLLISVTESAAGARQSLHLIPLAGESAAPQSRSLGPPRLVVRNPAWTPDGAFVVFEGDSPSYRDLYRIRRDGSGLRRLTDNPEGNFEPAVAPRGDALAFVSSRDRVAELYRIRLDGSEPRRLTRTLRDEWSPRWSADGSLLVFASDRDGADRLYLLRGADTVRVTDTDLNSRVIEESPCFSPQAALLAYVVRRPGSHAQLFVQDVATGSRRQVAAELQKELGEPAWSPDGRFLAFTGGQDADQQIYIARSDGSGAVRVTAGAGPNWNPRWVPAPRATAAAGSHAGG